MGLNETYTPFQQEGRLTPHLDDLERYFNGDGADFHGCFARPFAASCYAMRWRA